MRELTKDQAREEIEILDTISGFLSSALRENYNTLRNANPAARSSQGDVEFEARLHNIRRNLNEALEEVGRRGYGRVIFIREEDEEGKVLRHGVYRVSQANANLPEASILARNSPLGSQIASCRIGEELEIRLPRRETYFVVTSLIDVEGALQLLRPDPDIKLARFQVARDRQIDVVRGLRSFVRGLPQKTSESTPAPAAITPTKPEETVQQSPAATYWPSDWSSANLADDGDAALGAQFFTQTTREQEDAIKAVRGVTVVNGIAGTGKTSVALGRLKFFANFRSGEHLSDYGLNQQDWSDFDSSDMVGFVLSPSLVQYLKQTVEDLEMRMKVLDFEEFSNHEMQSRRLFARPFRRSTETNLKIQETVRWLQVLSAASSHHLGMAIEAIQQEPIVKPDTPDGRSVTDARWRTLESQLWRAGPLRARLVGMTRNLKSGDGLRGLAGSIDRDVRLSDRETAGLAAGERRALREAVLNLSLRLFRLLNPSDLYVEAYKTNLLADQLADAFPAEAELAASACDLTRRRLEGRMVTKEDVVTALCLNALACDQFERDIGDIPYVRTFSDRIAVFIDEYQDFSEQQVFLMGFRAKRKYRQITAAGDASQRLHEGGAINISSTFPYITDPIRQIKLDKNFRQSEALARLSQRFRVFTDLTEKLNAGPCGAPLHTYTDRAKFSEFAVQRIGTLPRTARVAFICPNKEKALAWFDLMAPSLESEFREPIVSDRARLTERFKTHFTTPLDAKGLEFDVVILPDISEFGHDNPIDVNGLYVAVSRPRHAILLGYDSANPKHNIADQLRRDGDLVSVSL